MSRYVVTRFLLMIPTLLAVAVLIFLLVRVVPGDIVELRLVSGGTYVTKDVIQAERARPCLNKPIWNQFVDWMVGLVRLDFGVSMWSGDKITHEIAIRLQLSLELAIPATIIATVLAIPLGTLAAVRRGTWIDQAVQLFSVAGLAVPSFWLGILMIFFLTSSAGVPPLRFPPLWKNPAPILAQLIWPARAVGSRRPDQLRQIGRG